MNRSVDDLLQAAERARAVGQSRDAVSLAQQALAIDPRHPRALNLLGHEALAGGDSAGARDFFQRAVDAAPDAAPLWLNLAIAERESGDKAAEGAALDRSLALDPYMVLALLQKAQWWESMGDASEALQAYRNLLACAPELEKLPPRLRPALVHGRSLVEADAAVFREKVAAELAPWNEDAGKRFDDFVSIATGQMRIYPQKPTEMHFPYLPPIPFFDRELFAWIDGLEAAAPAIRAEFLALMEDEGLFTPYVAYQPGQPVNQWAKLNHSRDWGAFFLWKYGERNDANCARCPATVDAMAKVPLIDMPGYAPSVFFSLLAPGAHIPPHTGPTNTRAVVHLALVVPEGCEYRVGGDIRRWEEGRVWVFDDTIEHEARNDSDQPRAILCFEVWNPFLTSAERDGITRLTRAASAHYGRTRIG